MTIDEIKAGLEARDEEIRRQAVQSIGESEDEELGELLLSALGDEDWRVRKEAVIVARNKAVSYGILPGLVDAICQEENIGWRNAALEVLEELGKEAADVLLDALPKVPDYARKFIIEALACGGDERVIPALVQAAEQNDSIVAAAALDALASIGGTDAELALRKQLKSKDSFHRLAAIDGLNRLKAVIPWEELKELLEDRLVKRVALSAIGRCGRIEAIDPLLQSLSERSTHIVSTAVVGLADLCLNSASIEREVASRLSHLDEEYLARIRTLLDKSAMDVRQASSYILCLARDRNALSGVIRLAASNAMSSSVLRALHIWGNETIVELLEFVDQGPISSRAIGIELASDIASDLTSVNPEIVARIRTTLRQALQHSDAVLVSAVVRSMGKWSEAQDASLLVQKAQNSPENIAELCGRTLMKLAQRERDAVEEAIRNVPLQGPAGASLVRLLTALGSEEAFTRLQSALAAPDAATRKAVVLGLAKLGGPKAAELITFSLADESVDVQMTAATVLGTLRDETGFPLGTESLLSALESDSPGVQAAAAQALGESGDSRVIEPLRALVRSGNAGIAVAAMKGLRRIGDPDMDDLLMDVLGHEDEEVVKQALIAMAEISGVRAVPRIGIGLEHAAWDVRCLSADLLGKMGHKSATKALIERLEKESDELVRNAIKEALSQSEEVD